MGLVNSWYKACCGEVGELLTSTPLSPLTFLPCRLDVYVGLAVRRRRLPRTPASSMASRAAVALAFRSLSINPPLGNTRALPLRSDTSSTSNRGWGMLPFTSICIASPERQLVGIHGGASG